MNSGDVKDTHDWLMICSKTQWVDIKVAGVIYSIKQFNLNIFPILQEELESEIVITYLFIMWFVSVNQIFRCGLKILKNLGCKKKKAFILNFSFRYSWNLSQWLTYKPFHSLNVKSFSYTQNMDYFFSFLHTIATSFMDIALLSNGMTSLLSFQKNR